MDVHNNKSTVNPLTVKTVLGEIFTENTTHMASALSYTTLLALVPLATVVLSMVARLPVLAEFSDQLQEFRYTNLH